jgi:hypothetical protein
VLVRPLRERARRTPVTSSTVGSTSDAEAAALEAILEKGLALVAGAPRTTVCRMCDMGRCRRIACPVVERQTELGAPPPPFVPLD